MLDIAEYQNSHLNMKIRANSNLNEHEVIITGHDAIKVANAIIVLCNVGLKNVSPTLTSTKIEVAADDEEF